MHSAFSYSCLNALVIDRSLTRHSRYYWYTPPDAPFLHPRKKWSQSSWNLKMPYPGREARFCEDEFQRSFRRLHDTKCLAARCPCYTSASPCPLLWKLTFSSIYMTSACSLHNSEILEATFISRIDVRLVNIPVVKRAVIHRRSVPEVRYMSQILTWLWRKFLWI